VRKKRKKKSAPEPHSNNPARKRRRLKAVAPVTKSGSGRTKAVILSGRLSGRISMLMGRDRRLDKLSHTERRGGCDGMNMYGHSLSLITYRSWSFFTSMGDERGIATG
jgi:hypothetical protein